MNRKLIWITAALLFTIVVATFLFYPNQSTKQSDGLISPLAKTLYWIQTKRQLTNLFPNDFSKPFAVPLASTSATPTPTPRPPTFAELNAQFGPCVMAPTLMFHHIQDLGVAKEQGHASLTVDMLNFQQDMQYLKDKGYTVLPLTNLIAFFDSGTRLPKKTVFLTFDDGYDDFGTDAWPILSSFQFPATLFVPTGLVQNPGYLLWSRIMDIAGSHLVLMANHTWSHHNMAASQSVISSEITLADTQLHDHDLNDPKTFAYPYGITSPYAIQFLQNAGYKLAFTTQHGSTLCKQQRLNLPRIRIGNEPLSGYGL